VADSKYQVCPDNDTPANELTTQTSTCPRQTTSEPWIIGGSAVIKSILTVAALLVVLIYSAAFFMWNANTTANVVTWQILGTPYWLPDVPIGFLPLAGAAIGAIIMAVAAWMPWAAQRKTARIAQEKLKTAIQRFKEQKQRVEAQNDRIEELQDEIVELEQQLAERTYDRTPQEEYQPAVSDEQPLSSGIDDDNTLT
jgi:hypothetical protein